MLYRNKPVRDWDLGITLYYGDVIRHAAIPVVIGSATIPLPPPPAAMHNPTAAEIDFALQLEGIVWAIDQTLGKGASAAAPELVAACIQRQAIRELSEAIYTVAGQIDNGLHAIANAIPEP